MVLMKLPTYLCADNLIAGVGEAYKNKDLRKDFKCETYLGKEYAADGEAAKPALNLDLGKEDDLGTFISSYDGRDHMKRARILIPCKLKRAGMRSTSARATSHQRGPGRAAHRNILDRTP